ncbi:MAG: galactokinase, partial [Leptospiraceae bacterium]|nr:galactokinase [Leptospiraceae bacterium]
LLLLDCRTLAHTLVPWQLHGFRLLLLDSGVKHSLAASEYNTRRAECEEGVKLLSQHCPHIKSLRDATLENLAKLRGEMPDPIFSRCQYVVEENARVLAAVEALQRNDAQNLGALLYQSHDGLARQYAVSCAELDFLVELAQQFGVAGARMMGGGFGGSTINLIADSMAEQFVEFAKRRFSARFGHAPAARSVAIADGARRVE